MFPAVKGSQGASARFAALVKAAGQPHVVTLWTRPEEDREFMKAVRGHRVLTVRQENTGTRKDHGEVGFVREGSNVYLVFPKSVKDFEGKRVIGIKYDLLAEAKPRGPARSARRERRKGPAAPRKKEAPAAKPEPRFAVEVERTAAARMTVEVTAKTAALARELALEQVKQMPVEVEHAAVRTRILSARKMTTNN
jgi:hypothetical protein